MQAENVNEYDDGSLAEPPRDYDNTSNFGSPEIAALFGTSEQVVEDDLALNEAAAEPENHLAMPTTDTSQDVPIEEPKPEIVQTDLEQEQKQEQLEELQAEAEEAAIQESIEEILTDEQKKQLENGEDSVASEEQLSALAKAVLARFANHQTNASMAQMMNAMQAQNQAAIQNGQFQAGVPLQQTQQSQKLSNAIMSTVSNAATAAANVSNLVTSTVSATAEGGQRLLQKYMDSKKLQVTGADAHPSVNADPIIATANMRESQVKQSVASYGQARDEFWAAPEMTNVKDKIRKLALERGLSERDVIAHINSGDKAFEEVSKTFNDAYNSSDKAKKAKEKMDVAIDKWQQNHERLNKTAFQLQAQNHPQAKDTFDVMSDSEKTMVSNASDVPKIEKEPQSNLEKIKENIQRIKEMASALAEKLSSLFGKKPSHESTNTPSPT